MYLEHYGLSRYPFGVTPDPEFLYLSSCHKQALAALFYGIRERQGFISLIGEVGCGKTLMLRAYLKRVDRTRLRFVYIFDPELAFETLMQQILADLGARTPPGSREPVIRTLHRYLIEAYRRQEIVVLIIDEAQRMPVETLERLRMLSNLETTRTKLIQIVLCGQPELEDTLRRHDLRQLRQRIAVRAHLRPLDSQESVAYLAHRIAVAGGDIDRILTRGAVRQVCKYAKGSPRFLNLLMGEVLITGYAKNEAPVTAATVREAYRDREGMPGKRPLRMAAALCAGLALVVGAIATAFLMEGDYWAWAGHENTNGQQDIREIEPGAAPNPDPESER